MACASEPPSLITSPATVSRCPTYGMSPPLRTWLWCFSSAYTSAFENWPVSFGVEVCSLTVGFPLSLTLTIARGGDIDICPAPGDKVGANDEVAQNRASRHSAPSRIVEKARRPHHCIMMH